MAEPFTIRIFVADGDPEGIRLVDRMNWTGLGLVFPRERWPGARQRPELGRTGVYVLVGPTEGDEDLPTVYVGEGDVVRDRLDSHVQQKNFWTHAYVFVTSNSGLNKAHIRASPHALDQRETVTAPSEDRGLFPQSYKLPIPISAQEAVRSLFVVGRVSVVYSLGTPKGVAALMLSALFPRPVQAVLRPGGEGYRGEATPLPGPKRGLSGVPSRA